MFSFIKKSCNASVAFVMILTFSGCAIIRRAKTAILDSSILKAFLMTSLGLKTL